MQTPLQLLAVLLALSGSMDKNTAPNVQVPEPKLEPLPLRYDQRCLSNCAKRNGNLLEDSCFDRCDRDSPNYDRGR